MCSKLTRAKRNLWLKKDQNGVTSFDRNIVCENILCQEGYRFPSNETGDQHCLVSLHW